MIASFIPWAVTLLEAYLVLGLLFALLFVIRGVGKVDPAARAGSFGFRCLVIPGVAFFWPLFLFRWAARRATPEESNAHRDLARNESRS